MTLSRRTPLRKRPAKRRTRSPRCDIRGCKQIVRLTYEVAQVQASETNISKILASALDSSGIKVKIMLSVCMKHARREADRLWSLAVRTGRCDLADWHRRLGVQCGGAIVGCHGFGKGAYPSVRYELWNGFSGCSGINQWTTEHPLEWDDFLRATWGPLYEERRRLALAVRKYDLAEVIAALNETRRTA